MHAKGMPAMAWTKTEAEMGTVRSYWEPCDVLAKQLKAGWESNTVLRERLDVPLGLSPWRHCADTSLKR